MYTPSQWVLIDCASQYGLDKKPFDERLTFGREILEQVKEKADLSSWIEEADEPEMFNKSLLTIEDILNGIPNGHLIGLDAASSGPQILSVLGRCVTGMSNTGALGNEVPDLYSTIYAHMDGEGLTRLQVKRAAVPYAYGSSYLPEEIFGDDVEEFTSAYAVTLPFAFAIRQVLLAAADSDALSYHWIMPDMHNVLIEVTESKLIKGKFLNKSYTQNVKLKKAKKVDMSLPAHVTHSFDGFITREITGRCSWDNSLLEGIAAIKHHLSHGSAKSNRKLQAIEKLSKEFNFISIQGYEFITRGCLADVSEGYLEGLLALGLKCIQYPSFDIRCTHDEFACQANHVGYMQLMYNLILREAYESTWLTSVIKKLAGIDLTAILPVPDPLISKQIEKAMYAIN